MKRLINFRTGLVTLGLLVGLSAPAFSVPMPAPATPTAPINTDTLKVRDSWAGGGGGGGVRVDEWRRGWRGDRGWRRDGGWRGDGWRGRHWRGHRHWRDDGWRYRRHYRRGWDNPGVYLGLGLLGSGLLYNDNYYYRPRVYRAPRASGHVQWCYSRYRSYRAWDNTFQPNYGPRRQCISPYRY